MNSDNIIIYVCVYTCIYIKQKEKYPNTKKLTTTSGNFLRPFALKHGEFATLEGFFVHKNKNW